MTATDNQRGSIGLPLLYRSLGRFLDDDLLSSESREKSANCRKKKKLTLRWKSRIDPLAAVLRPVMSASALYWTLSHNCLGHSWEISLKRQQHRNGGAPAMATPQNDVRCIKVWLSWDSKSRYNIVQWQHQQLIQQQWWQRSSEKSSYE